MNYKDIIETTVFCNSRHRVFRHNVVECANQQVVNALRFKTNPSQEEIIDLLIKAIDDNTIFFDDDGPSPLMHCAVMGENT